MATRVKVTKDLKGVKTKVNRMTKLGQYALVNQAYADMNLYVPMKSSDLRNQSTIANDGKSVIWNAKYARAQFFGTNGKAIFRKYTTPGTGPRWDQKALSIHRKDWERITKKAMK